MKYALLLLLVACGSEIPADPGICFDNGWVVWRPCDTVSDTSCAVRVLDSTEIRPLSETVSCADCYYGHGVPMGDCK